MVAITQFVAAGLMTVAVQALPQAGAYASAAPISSSKGDAYPSPSAVAIPSSKIGAIPSASPVSNPSSGSGSPDSQVALFTTLFTAPTQVKRFRALLTETVGTVTKLLTGDALKKEIVFPFTRKANDTGLGGQAVAANIETFPILTDLGISTTVGFMNPCGINTPHVHPRATEFLTVVEGKNVKFGYVLENGLVSANQNQEIAGSLDKLEGTVFPMGSIHFQFNDNCDPAVFVAALNSEDPGTNQIAQGFFALNSQVVNATLGMPKEINGTNIEQFRSKIPANLAQDMDICLKKCGSGKNY